MITMPVSLAFVCVCVCVCVCRCFCLSHGGLPENLVSGSSPQCYDRVEEGGWLSLPGVQSVSETLKQQPPVNRKPRRAGDVSQ
jgi:hypothetical protein